MDNKEDFIIRSYSKKELALLYFPDTPNPHTAVNHLMAWLRRCTPLTRELEEMGVQKTAKYFTPRQVRAIARHLGEP